MVVVLIRALGKAFMISLAAYIPIPFPYPPLHAETSIVYARRTWSLEVGAPMEQLHSMYLFHTGNTLREY